MLLNSSQSIVLAAENESSKASMTLYDESWLSNLGRSAISNCNLERLRSNETVRENVKMMRRMSFIPNIKAKGVVLKDYTHYKNTILRGIMINREYNL